ncbi:MAG TPA: hypothetical protein VM938_03220 [Acidimicrobiales bacterium]|nr:hypothetical protein [Acidimicrobiales bacterium]
MKSLRQGLAVLGHTGPFSWQEHLHCPPPSVRELLGYCTDSRVNEWVRWPEPMWQVDNEAWTEEAQGVTWGRDGWYVATNADDGREGLYRLVPGTSSATWTRLAPRLATGTVHHGAPCEWEEWIYVPVQHATWGVWKVRADFTADAVLTAADRPADDLFPWCDVNPANGLLYTCNFSFPTKLYAYDASATVDGVMPRVDKEDITLHWGDPPPNGVQGACFTTNRRLLMIHDVKDDDEDELVQCYSAITGRLLGQMSLHADADESTPTTLNELESVRLATVTAKGVTTHIQVLELNNEGFSEDDFYLWGIAVPDPSLL